MVNLPVIGTVKYNGYTFGVATETESIRGKPVYDSSGRNISYIVWTVSLRTIIATSEPTTTDNTISALRSTLMAVGKPFQYEDKGFGDLVVNIGNAKDVAWGPKPQSFSWKPFSSRHAVEVSWVVEVALPQCDNAKYNGVLEATFSVSFARDKYGLTRRTFNGELKIASTRNGNRLAETVDDYLEKFIPPVPKHFQRISQTEDIAKDKTSLTITVVDEEYKSENVPPEGVVEVSLEHDIGCRGAGSEAKSFFTKHMGRLTGTYTVVRGKPMRLAVEHFTKVVEDRVFRLLKDLKKEGQGKSGDLYCVLPTSSSITEVDAYGLQRVKCNFTYLMVGPPSIFMTRGLFRKMPNSNDELWAKSMAPIWHPRGWAGLTLDVNDDVIIDLCVNAKMPTIDNRQFGRDTAVKGVQFVNEEKAKGWTWPTPDKDKSFVDIQTSFTLEPQDHVMRHVPLESGEARLRTPALLGEDSFARLAAVTKGSNPPIYQTRAATMPALIFEGSMIRAGWPVQAPILKSAYGMQAIPSNGDGYGFRQETYPYSGPVPIFIGVWRLRYLLSDRPVDVLAQGVGGQGQAQAGVQPQVPQGGPIRLPQLPLPFGGGNGMQSTGNESSGLTSLFGSNAGAVGGLSGNWELE